MLELRLDARKIFLHRSKSNHELNADETWIFREKPRNSILYNRLCRTPGCFNDIVELQVQLALMLSSIPNFRMIISIDSSGEIGIVVK